MRRLVVRTFLGILITFVVSIAVTLYLGWRQAGYPDSRIPPPFYGELVKTLVDRLAASDVEALVAQLSRSENTAKFVPLDAPEIPENAAKRLRKGEPTWVMRWNDNDGEERAGLFILVPFNEKKRAILLGPMSPPRPDTSVFILSGLAAIVIIFAGGLILSRPLVVRLRQLESVAQQISKGDLGARAAVQKKDPVGSLVRTFNAMAERIQALLESQRQIVQAVAHELRTPISRIRFGLEMLDMERREEDIRKRRQAIDADLKELDCLLEELLLYSKYDAGRAKLAPVDCDPTDAIYAHIDRLIPMYPSLRFNATPARLERAVELDPRSFNRVVGNLLSNASRYAQKQVSVVCELASDRLTVTVSDDGPGIPDMMRQKVFEPFVRLDESRNRASGGTGLGLAIVKRIMHLNRGSVSIGTAEGGGAKVVTVWPL